MFCRLVYDLLPSGEWWDTILADSDRWGARKFTIGPFTAPVWRSRCDVPSEPTSISGMSALHGLAGQGWVTDTPRMNPVQWRGMPSTCRALAAANVDRRSRDGQPFRRTLITLWTFTGFNRRTFAIWVTKRVSKLN